MGVDNDNCTRQYGKDGEGRSLSAMLLRPNWISHKYKSVNCYNYIIIGKKHQDNVTTVGIINEKTCRKTRSSREISLTSRSMLVDVA